MHATLRCSLLALAAACSGAEKATTDTPAVAADGAPAPATAAPPPAAASNRLTGCAAPSGRDTLCFHAERAQHLAGDGRPFRLTVDAVGPAPDSMRVALRIVRGDTVYYRADWNTVMYGRYDGGPVAPDSARRRAESQLARVLSDDAFRTTAAFLGAGSDAQGMLRETVAFDLAVAGERQRRGLTPADTLPTDAAQSPRPFTDTARVRALAAELRDVPAFRYYAGGEATYAIAWSPSERRFVVVSACC